MSIQAGPQTLLVKVMRNQTNTPTKHKQSVQDTHVEVVFGFLGTEGAAVSHQINKAYCDAAIDVENEVVLLGSGNSLDSDCVVKHLAAREALFDELFDKLDTEIRVVAGLDFVADTGNCIH